RVTKYSASALKSGQLKSGGVCSTLEQSAGRTCADELVDAVQSGVVSGTQVWACAANGSPAVRKSVPATRIATAADLRAAVIEVVRKRRACSLSSALAEERG